jgi:thiol-disulfide isomerase/thioredoxin
MEPLGPGQAAPPLDGLDLGDPTLLVFYKVTCPVCQLAAPVVERLHEAYPGRVRGIGQDPDAALAEFGRTYGMTASVMSDGPPYAASNAYGVRVVPTLFLVDGGKIRDVVESWDRDGFNRVSAELADLTYQDPVVVSTPEDGLPSFRPG